MVISSLSYALLRRAGRAPLAERLAHSPAVSVEDVALGAGWSIALRQAKDHEPDRLGSAAAGAGNADHRDRQIHGLGRHREQIAQG